MTTPAKSEKDRVVIFDTTLRDGEQCPGATMTFDEKLEVAELLDEMGVLPGLSTVPSRRTVPGITKAAGSFRPALPLGHPS